MLCMASGDWHLVGVSAWRRGCSGTSSQRPRLYDRVSVAARWAGKTMDTMDDEIKDKMVRRIPKRRNGREEG